MAFYAVTKKLYPPRILAFRKEMIKAIPKVPNTKPTVDYMNTFGTHHLMLIYLTWKMRLVSSRPRKVLIWAGGVKPEYLATIKSEVSPLAIKVEQGKDLTHHLSGLVQTIGFAMPEVSSEKRRLVMDGVLTKMGLHHFHVGAMTANNPRGRSGKLVFADVTDDEFKIIAISDHDAFNIGSAEWSRLFGISNNYIQSQIPQGKAYMAYPTMSSGHSAELQNYADWCDEKMKSDDPYLDDHAFIDKLYSNNDASSSIDLKRPVKPTLKWHFENLNFGLLEIKTRIFFRIYCSPR